VVAQSRAMSDHSLLPLLDPLNSLESEEDVASFQQAVQILLLKVPTLKYCLWAAGVAMSPLLQFQQIHNPVPVNLVTLSDSN
jgi:hypothetical protein